MPLPIQTKRLVLRPKTLDDVDQLATIYMDPRVMRFFAGGATTLEGVRELVERDISGQDEYGFSMWAVVDKRTGEIVGDAGFQHLEEGPEIEVGIRLTSRYWGAGFADEVAGALWDYGILELGLERAVGVALPGNRASRRLMERCGMTFAGKGTFYGRRGVKYVGTRESYLRRRQAEEATT
jgi:RimJ/RimL family protein N-acetyltransferase